MAKEEQQALDGILAKPLFGTTMAVAAGLSFFFLCMIRPLVGPSGSKVAHAAKNKSAFLGVLVVTFLLAAMATFSKMQQRKADGGPLPYWSLGLCGVCILTLFILIAGGFSI